MFDNILPHFVTPLVHGNLRRSFAAVYTDRTVSMQSLYRGIQASVQLTPEDLAEFKRQALLSIEYEMPWWLPSGYFEAVVNDLAQQYVWYGRGASHRRGASCFRFGKPIQMYVGKRWW